ncbi:MAG: peptide chain release factor 1 [Clostridiales bacterium]|nr:peptide chain release factor 1 [Clostridiales bacterium]
MLERLDKIEEVYDELTEKISDPKIIGDQTAWREYTKKHAAMQETVDVYHEYKRVLQQIKDNQDLMEEGGLDQEMEELVKADLSDLASKEEEINNRLHVLLLPKDPNDDKNVLLEIRGGTGGDEAALFAGDLMRMYSRFAENQGWYIDVMDANITDIGGVKEAILLVEGRGAYSRLKYESGVHRVQRVPETESSGRIHTSAATVAVMPEAEEVDIEIDPADVRVDIFCSSGPGGQSVNTTKSAIRLTHVPSGIVVSCQDEKSQIKNKDKAMKVLRSRLLEKALDEQQGQQASTRRSMVGSGDRSERIRTYNFPQGRVTDHRIGLTSYKLEYVLQGDLGEFIEALTNADQAQQLKAGQDE